MVDYWTRTRCHHKEHCGIDFHDHTQNREDVVWNSSGIHSVMLLTNRAIDIVKNHDQTKVKYLHFLR